MELKAKSKNVTRQAFYCRGKWSPPKYNTVAYLFAGPSRIYTELRMCQGDCIPVYVRKGHHPARLHDVLTDFSPYLLFFASQYTTRGIQLLTIGLVHTYARCFCASWEKEQGFWCEIFVVFDINDQLKK